MYNAQKDIINSTQPSFALIHCENIETLRVKETVKWAIPLNKQQTHTDRDGYTPCIYTYRLSANADQWLHKTNIT